jgi:hypothetical protein
MKRSNAQEAHEARKHGARSDARPVFLIAESIVRGKAGCGTFLKTQDSRLKSFIRMLSKLSGYEIHVAQ